MTEDPKPDAIKPDEKLQSPADLPAAEKEVGGRGGPDPVRYGDWEKGGIAVDF